MEQDTVRVQAPFVIAGVPYRMEPLSWQQNKWLGEHIFVGIDLQALDYAVIHDLLRERGPLFMAIVLLPPNLTRAQQAKQPWATIQALADSFAGELTGAEVARFGPRFFLSNPPDQMSMLLSGKVLMQAVLASAAPSAAPTDNGSSTVSSPSPTETSRSSASSLPSSDPLIQIRTSDAASSDRPSIAPSLDGSALSCPG